MISPRLGFDSSWKCTARENRQLCARIKKSRELFQNGKGCTGKRVGKMIGRGICGVVMETTCEKKDKYVTKVIQFGNCYSIDKFYREVWAQNEAATAGIAPRILESHVTNTQAVIVMERVFGQTVDALNQKHVTSARSDADLSRKAARLAAQIGKTLSTLHRLGIAHGDSHVQNMIVDGTGRVNLIDFGRAHFLGGGDLQSDIKSINTDYSYAVQTFLNDYPQYQQVQIKSIEPFLKRDVDAIKMSGKSGKSGKTVRKTGKTGKTVRKTVRKTVKKKA